MKKILIVFLMSSMTTAMAADSWKVTPKLYSRAGFTQSIDLESRGNTDMSKWNPGSWGGESNGFIGNLTEVDVHAYYGKKAHIVYGVNIDGSQRFEQADGSTEYKERQAYIEFYDAIAGMPGATLWVGRRPYRGYGDYLTGSFPLDERNMMGAGFTLPIDSKSKYEFAYAVNDKDKATGTGNVATDENFTTNIFINKYSRDIENGNVTVNAEIHQNNARDKEYETYGYMLGGQYAKWNMKAFDAKWYNIFVLNYAYGYTGDVEAGVMGGPFTVRNKDQEAHKVLFKIGGDMKADKWAAYYTFKYQWHKGDRKEGAGQDFGDQEWSVFDIYARPMYALTTNFGIGIDYVQRFVLSEPSAAEASDLGVDWVRNQNMNRVGVIGTYHMLDGAADIFKNCEMSLIVGRAHKEVKTAYFQGRNSKKNADFIRLKYTMEF